MRRFWLPPFVVLLGILASAEVQGGQFGPPEPGAKEDKPTYGVGYFSQDAKWTADTPVSTVNVRLTDIQVRRTMYFGEIHAYGWNLSEEGEGFLRVGSVDFDGGGIQGDGKVSASVGMKEYLRRFGGGRYGIGTIFQANYYASQKGTLTTGGGTSVDITVKAAFDASLALAGQAKLFDYLTVYGGPFAYFGIVKIEAEDLSTSPSSTYSSDYTDEDRVGLFAGGRFILARDLLITAEGQYRGRFSGGVSVAYRF